MIKLLAKIALVILLAFILSLSLDSLYRHTYSLDYIVPRNIFIHPEIAEKYEIVRVGNSHAEYGLTFAHYKLKSLLLSSVAQSFEYDLPMLKMFSRQIKAGAPIIITVSPISFSQKKPGKDDNVNMNYYDGRLSPFLIPHIKLAEYIQRQIFPFLRSGFLWREKYAQEAKERATSTYAQTWKTKPAAINSLPKDPAPTAGNKNHSPPVQSRTFEPSFNVKEIQAELAALPEPSDEKLVKSTGFMVDKWLRSEDFGTQYFEANRKDLEELINYCLEKKWHPILVTLPTSQVLLDKLDGLENNFLQRYVYDHIKKVQFPGVTYYDFASNETLTKDRYLFSNSDHLNGRGAAIVSYLLLQQLIAADFIPKSADGYDYSLN